MRDPCDSARSTFSGARGFATLYGSPPQSATRSGSMDPPPPPPRIRVTKANARAADDATRTAGAPIWRICDAISPTVVRAGEAALGTDARAAGELPARTIERIAAIGVDALSDIPDPADLLGRIA